MRLLEPFAGGLGQNRRGKRAEDLAVLDALIQNLASWAADGHTRKASLVGMVAFLDLSEDEGTRYAWVREISLVDVCESVPDVEWPPPSSPMAK